MLVVGDDGKVRWLRPGHLQPVRDEGGNTSWPTKDTSLSPDGTRAAFPQPDRLVVADLTTGLIRTFTAPGLNEWVLWAPGTADVLVGSATAAYRVNTLNGDRARIAVPAGAPPSTGPSKSSSSTRQGAHRPHKAAQPRSSPPTTGGLSRGR